MFQGCPKGYGAKEGTSQCLKCTTTNCEKCYISVYVTSTNKVTLSQCQTCRKGYGLSYTLDQTTYAYVEKCYLIEGPIALNLFVKGGAPYNYTLSNQYFLNNINNAGTQPTAPLLVIQQAINKIIDYASNYGFINITVYLGNQNHNLFVCKSKQTQPSGVISYCASSTSSQPYIYVPAIPPHDNIYYSFKPLDCGIDLGFEGAEYAAFQQMCIFNSKLNKPTIYVNSAYAKFPVYGFASFENIVFSGINSMAIPLISKYILDYLPIVYCKSQTPENGNSTLKLSKNTIKDFNVAFKCTNQYFTTPTIPKFSNSTRVCQRNSGNQFYSKQESTLACAGDPLGPDFFTTSGDYSPITYGQGNNQIKIQKTFPM